MDDETLRNDVEVILGWCRDFRSTKQPLAQLGYELYCDPDLNLDDLLKYGFYETPDLYDPGRPATAAMKQFMTAAAQFWQAKEYLQVADEALSKGFFGGRPREDVMTKLQGRDCD